jgi:hypothetical protein
LQFIKNSADADFETRGSTPNPELTQTQLISVHGTPCLQIRQSANTKRACCSVLSNSHTQCLGFPRPTTPQFSADTTEPPTTSLSLTPIAAYRIRAVSQDWPYSQRQSQVLADRPHIRDFHSPPRRACSQNSGKSSVHDGYGAGPHPGQAKGRPGQRDGERSFHKVSG